jgi:phage terminase small subunit
LWRSVLAAVHDGWELDERDLAVLERACRLADRAAELEAAITEHGTMTKGSTGQLVVNPAVAEARQTHAAVARLLGQIEIAPPKATTRHLNGRQRDVLRDLRVIS